jgi:hypothetical protein
MKRCRVLLCLLLASFWVLSGTARPQAVAAALAYPDISGNYSVTETYTATASALDESDTISGTATNPSVRITQSGNVFTIFTRDPDSGVSVTDTGVLSGNMIVSMNGPAFGFANIPGLVVNYNQITSASGTVQQNRITLNVTGAADIVVSGAAADQVGVPSGTAIHYAITATVVLSGAVTPLPSVDTNYEGLWWNSPANSESGWGINFAHQGDVIFASWFTYDIAGKGWWLVMTANNTGGNSFSGTLFETTGPAFDAVPFPPQGNPGGITGSAVGTGTLTFADANNGTFTYTVKGVTQTKAITRQIFGPLPTCIFSASNNPAVATNYQDLWWAKPAGSESGWGINFTHQGDTIFATWFTFDHDHSPMWLVVTANKSAPRVYTGALFRTIGGPPFNSVPFPPLGSPGGATFRQVGTATITFSDGNNAQFAYTVDGVSQTKAITRQVFRPSGTVCQ